MPQAVPGCSAPQPTRQEERQREHLFREIEFRDGPTGRRASVRGGVDVWEIAQTLRAVREAEPGLGDGEAAEWVVEVTSSSLEDVAAAVRYAQAYPEEIDAQVDENLAAAERLGKRFQQQLTPSWR